MDNLFDEVRAVSQISAFSPGRELPEDLGDFQHAIGDIQGSYVHLQREAYGDIRAKSVSDAHKYSSKFPEVSVETLATEIATIRLLKSIAGRVQGYFHLPTNPTQCFSVDRTVANARRVLYLCRKSGIHRSSIVIRIFSTVEGFKACEELSKQDIKTSAIAPAMLEQVARAAEAGCAFIAPPCSDFCDVDRQYDFRLVTAARDYLEKFGYSCSVLPEGPFHFGSALVLMGMKSIALDPLAMCELKHVTQWDRNWKYFGYFAQIEFPNLEKLVFQDDGDYQTKLLNRPSGGGPAVELPTYTYIRHACQVQQDFENYMRQFC
ncbi:hypothetical protein EV356DRAFT_497583 [Viridothelium virens]|uniref:Uncharacterized protein n=1 Tax=Viridothelium virens TaxID=1048519 RepID=A0A6A6HGX3_VIRVR|nr:hypothetical protein EV356DRAFT_497583 [Viridothelium virens]